MTSQPRDPEHARAQLPSEPAPEGTEWVRGPDGAWRAVPLRKRWVSDPTLAVIVAVTFAIGGLVIVGMIVAAVISAASNFKLFPNK